MSRPTCGETTRIDQLSVDRVLKPGNSCNFCRGNTPNQDDLPAKGEYNYQVTGAGHLQVRICPECLDELNGKIKDRWGHDQKSQR